MEKSNKIEILRQEYFKLQDFYESFDSKAQLIKGWSTTISIAAITAGFAYENEFIWLLAALTALVFWRMEAKWKIFQYCYGSRIRVIEKAFADDNFDLITPLQIYSSWFEAWRKGDYKELHIMRLKLVLTPYVYAIVICLGLFFMKISFPSLFWTPTIS